jgi:tetratricopeptide (TPR) repeat protein
LKSIKKFYNGKLKTGETMNLLTKSKLLIILLLLIPCQRVVAQDGNTALQELQKSWAVANYQLDGDAQVQAFENLIVLAQKRLADQSTDAELQIWTGIIKSTFAGVKGGLGALGLAKAARKHLETAIAIDAEALDGSAYTSLGTLYANVPGWPIGFGDKKKAAKYLQMALATNPDGIDSNYFYAEYLTMKKKYKEARSYYQKAQSAAPRLGREIADTGRQNEITEALHRIAQD